MNVRRAPSPFAPALLTFVAYLVVGLWGARFPPAADGVFYDVFATRLARGLGYTWEWPDHTVTYAAHYPVGYPAILSLVYRLPGPHASLVALLHAFVAAVGSAALAATAWKSGSRGILATAAALAFMHPALLFYAPAIMTEGITSALLVVALWLVTTGRAVRYRRRLWVTVPLGIVLGAVTLVRPQSILLAPVAGALLVAGRAPVSRVVASAILTAALALATCAPWTARNCERMHACALVSVNGGWNLLIGAETNSGAWDELQVPAECATVWDEAKKDQCFAGAARRMVARAPALWLGKIPRKLAVTFAYFGAAGWYLHQGNPAAFSYDAKFRLGVIETLVSRLLLLVAIARVALAWGPGRSLRRIAGPVAAFFACTPVGWPAYLLLAGMLVPFAADAPLFGFAAGVIAHVAAVHAAFFGAGRYGLVVVPFVIAVAFARFPSRRSRARPSRTLRASGPLAPRPA